MGLLALALSLDHVPATDIALTVPFAAEGPGPTFNTLGDVEGTPVVDVEGAEVDPTEGNLNMTTVSVRTNMTLAQALGRWIGTGDTLVPLGQVIPPDVSEEELRRLNESAFVASEAAATVAAMNHLGLPTEVVVHDLVPGSAADGVLEPGDVITAVDARGVSQPGEVQDLVRARAAGEKVVLGVRRGERAFDVEATLGDNPEEPGSPQLGVLMTSQPAGDVSVDYNLNDVGGPSAGMMFSLAVIDKLSPGLLNGGRFVAGTGTIAEDGKVGPIGGIAHKIRAARDAGAELFLAPAGNCSEVARVDSGEMVVAGVATLDDAISAMQDFSAGRDVPACR
ncbi:PDZ domain-containing protein [Corynebacterium liangguodongii]|uniref:endopeptidase La n=1 Tax=Corynebacterium liangguodongii TaxID=2079535 RepID=A0A2S0WH56_9CORY|nr:PDZ domain-containing protein [Corynebacterium liangguodongii]AWB85012.1 PDZ domain-containing protein [Corynebacterium liangguodongii]PWC00670.1 PDZ domain-containing protein [Corynebacterium liangguodongii]